MERVRYKKSKNKSHWDEIFNGQVWNKKEKCYSDIHLFYQ